MEILNSFEAQSALFQFATIGIILTNDRGEIILLNTTAERMFGYGKDDLRGKRVEALIPAHFRDAHVRHREQYGVKPKPRPMGGVGMNLAGRKNDGSEFPVEISLSPFSNEKGQFVIAFITDITIRKQQEQVLLEAHHELKRYAEELKRFNEEMKEFNYVSSHHLQEPLRKIQTYGNILLAEEAPKMSSQGKDYLKKILVSTEMMRDRVNDFILFTRLGTKEQIRVPSNLQVILKQTLSELGVLIEHERAQVKIISELPVIYADPIQMGKLFLNLISNAIKFHRSNVPPVIKIHHRMIPAAAGEREKIEILFEDNGIGFDERFSEQIFYLFKKNVESEGQGIGLAISRKICNLHEGNLTARSKLGEGSTFIVTLTTAPMEKLI